MTLKTVEEVKAVCDHCGLSFSIPASSNVSASLLLAGWYYYRGVSADKHFCRKCMENQMTLGYMA